MKSKKSNKAPENQKRVELMNQLAELISKRISFLQTFKDGVPKMTKGKAKICLALLRDHLLDTQKDLNKIQRKLNRIDRTQIY